MNPRVGAARWLLRAGNFLRSLAVVVMRPADLVEFSRQNYATPESVEAWSRDEVVNAGLSPEELALLEQVPTTRGRLLLLGVGGGREAIPLARRGFEVTAVDFVGAMVARAVERAARAGVQLGGLVQDIAALDVPAESYDVVWLSAAMYSSVPTRAGRQAMLRRVHRALKPGGHFVCQFHYDPGWRSSRGGERLRRIFGWLVLGNTRYEPGDTLWGGREFLHVFVSAANIRSEFETAGWEVIGRASCRERV